jgi:GNAT superfamily N-acetyltransferase
MMDGSLMLWGLSPEDYEGFVREELLDKGYFSSFDRMKKCSIEGSFALCAYTSFPRNTEVTNAMRVYMCGRDSLDCERCCQEKRKRECDDVAGVTDGVLFDTLLGVGQRSAVFSSGWQNVQKYYGEHKISFFYLKAGDEIARIEIPQWVAERDELVGLVHALALDQCRRGQGYPVALMEAHEKAVVTGADREAFRLLVERAMADRGMNIQTSGKSRSKRTWGV